MSDLVVESGLLLFIAILLGAFVVGLVLASVAWRVLARRRREESARTPGDEREPLYLAFSRLSHRLKTAGEVIRGHLHGFTDELPTDAERWHVARRAIFDEATQITGAVERLDLVVRLGMVGQPLVMEPVNVAQLMEDLMIGLGPAADSRGVLLGGVVQDSTRSDPYVSADSAALREAFSNILENAIVHGKNGSEVTADIAGRDDRLVVKISDTGGGMDAELLEALFEKGGRRYRPRSSQGTGTGLYVSKLLIELHGGSITATSQPGQGTTLEITLPTRRTDQPGANLTRQ